MLGARLMQLIEAHAQGLTEDVVRDLTTNERTPNFARLKPAELEYRVSTLCWNLGKWIGNPDDDIVREEYEEMGRVRFREGVPVSEVVYALLLTKQHLRRYIRDYALVDFAGDRVVPDELLPIELQSVQELNYQVGEFFDRALSSGSRLRAGGSLRHGRVLSAARTEAPARRPLIPPIDRRDCGSLR